MPEKLDALMDQCALELMNAFESKDKESFIESFHALVCDLLMKLQDEPEMGEES